MKATTVLRILIAVALLITLLGCIGFLNLVRTSPDGRYLTVIDSDESRSRLLLYDLNTHETTEVYTSKDDSLDFYDIQWRPDSQAFCFVATHEREYSLMLYEVDSHRLAQLPVESPGLARWSRDGRQLLVLNTANGEDRYELYDTASWTRVRSYPSPFNYQASDTVIAQLLRDERVLILGKPTDTSDNFPQGYNLYLFSGNRWQPYTTTGDVVAFWVAPDESSVRWVRQHRDKWLAVFESPLGKRMPRRLALLENGAFAQEGVIYRFSPDGMKLAYWTEEGVCVLNLQTNTVRVIELLDLSPRKVSGGFGESLQTRYPILGLDWRGSDTLVIQRRGEVEMLSVHSLRR
ncbi:hypothetical protein HRbin15_00806 [bacterium HR15]|nr:hypothetical protein HRbin15_00806 [bacterium HR15]